VTALLIASIVAAPSPYVFTSSYTGSPNGSVLTFTDPRPLVDLQNGVAVFVLSAPGFAGWSLNLPSFSLVLGGHAFEVGPSMAEHSNTEYDIDPSGPLVPVRSYYVLGYSLTDGAIPPLQSVLDDMRDQINADALTYEIIKSGDGWDEVAHLSGPSLNYFVASGLVASGMPVPEPSSWLGWLLCASTCVAIRRQFPCFPRPGNVNQP
jgi:hypothetical protein